MQYRALSINRAARFSGIALVTGLAAVMAPPATGQVINEDTKLVPSDRADGDQFGWAIAIDDRVVAVGAVNNNDNGIDSGSAYLFDAVTGDQIFKLLPNDGAEYDHFGVSIAIDDGVVAVGVYGNDDHGTSSGSAYLFDAANGVQIAKLLPSDNAAYDNFGYSIAIDSGSVAVGARYDQDNGTNSGSTYLFDASSGEQITKLLPSDGAAGDRFGWSIAIDNGAAAVGSYFDDDNGADSGSAYVFDTNCLYLSVDNLVAGERALIGIAGGTSGAKCVTVFGLAAGRTFVNGLGGYCAAFGIKDIDRSLVIGGLNQVFDGDGEIGFTQFIPRGALGKHVFFQSAERGTCPDECMSNLVEATVQ